MIFYDCCAAYYCFSTQTRLKDRLGQSCENQAMLAVMTKITQSSACFLVVLKYRIL